MSVKLMTQVWGLALPHPEKMILLALADHANDEGEQVYPSVAYLAWKTDYSINQVRRILQALAADGIIVPVGTMNGGRGHPTTYRIQTEKAPTKGAFVPPKDSHHGTKTPSTGGITNPPILVKTPILVVKTPTMVQNPPIAMGGEPSVTIEPSRTTTTQQPELLTGMVNWPPWAEPFRALVHVQQPAKLAAIIAGLNHVAAKLTAEGKDVDLLTEAHKFAVHWQPPKVLKNPPAAFDNWAQMAWNIQKRNGHGNGKEAFEGWKD